MMLCFGAGEAGAWNLRQQAGGGLVELVAGATNAGVQGATLAPSDAVAARLSADAGFAGMLSLYDAAPACFAHGQVPAGCGFSNLGCDFTLNGEETGKLRDLLASGAGGTEGSLCLGIPFRAKYTLH